MKYTLFPISKESFQTLLLSESYKLFDLQVQQIHFPPIFSSGNSAAKIYNTGNLFLQPPRTISSFPFQPLLIFSLGPFQLAPNSRSQSRSTCFRFLSRQQLTSGTNISGFSVLHGKYIRKLAGFNNNYILSSLIVAQVDHSFVSCHCHQVPQGSGVSTGL